MEVLVPEIKDKVRVDVPEIQGYVAPIQVEAYVVSELVHVLPR